MQKIKITKLSDSKKIKGWLCGQFFPEGSLEHSKEVEVKYAELDTDYKEAPHYHPHGREVIIVLKGKMEWMVGEKQYTIQGGQVAHITSGFPEYIMKVLEPVVLITVRTPSVPDNKAYIGS